MGAQNSNINLKYNSQYGYHSESNLGITKYYELTSKDEQQCFKNLLQRYNNFNVPTILPILASQPILDTKQLKYSWNLTFKKLSQTLEQEMGYMKNNNKLYSQSNILKLIDCVLSALIAFRLKDLTHGNINCLNILVDYTAQNEIIDENSKIYVIGLPLLLNPNFERQIIKEKNYNKLYLSPLNLLEISERREKLTICQKSQIFSLGLVALRLATQCEIQEFYDYENFVFKESALLRRLKECQTIYSGEFCQMLAKMTQFQQQKRPDFQQLYRIFGGIRVQNQQVEVNRSIRDWGKERKESRKIIQLNCSKKKNDEHLKRSKHQTVEISNGQNSHRWQPTNEIMSALLVQSFHISNQSRRAWIKIQQRWSNSVFNKNHI